MEAAATSNGKMSETHSTEKTTLVIVSWLVGLLPPNILSLSLPATNMSQPWADGKRIKT